MAFSTDEVESKYIAVTTDRIINTRRAFDRWQLNLFFTQNFIEIGIVYCDGTALAPDRFCRAATTTQAKCSRRLHKTSSRPTFWILILPENTDHTYFEYDHSGHTHL